MKIGVKHAKITLTLTGRQVDDTFNSRVIVNIEDQSGRKWQGKIITVDPLLAR